MIVQSKLLKSFYEYKSQFDEYLFSGDHRERLGLFRFLFCSIMFYIACFRQLNVDQYGPHSLIPRTEAMSVFSDYYKPFFQLFFWPDSMASATHLIYIFLLLLALLGLSNRPLLFLTWVLAQGFIQRNFSILFGADVIGTLLLFYLSFTRCNDYFSLKNILSANRAVKTFKPDMLSNVFVRLLQMQMFTIYAYTGFEKLKGTTWWDGTALWTVLVNPQFTSYNLLFLKEIPIFFAVGTFVTIVFEVYFPFLVAYKKTRALWLSLGILFHLMIGVLLDLMPFSLVMISTYILFIDRLTLSHFVDVLLNRFKKIVQRA